MRKRSSLDGMRVESSQNDQHILSVARLGLSLIVQATYRGFDSSALLILG
jgi:hypothetical protein